MVAYQGVLVTTARPTRDMFGNMKQTEKKRTDRQSRALHLYFEHLAFELNDAGLDMRKTLKPGVEIPWSGDTIKEYIWRPIMEAQIGKKSTTEMTTKDIDTVFDTITRHLANRFGLQVDFPSIETQIMDERTK